ncbi:nuclear pore complex protein Nup107-like [Ornithodoros turicata]|uniref:nuclear pore complex protein Nup107-like n=1 Tax=Ornithodoros turicata TaxID=34597 RepID=UPI0031387ED4
MADPFAYSLANLPTPKIEKRSSRFSNRSASFQRTPGNLSSSSVLDRTLQSGKKPYSVVLRTDTFLNNTTVHGGLYGDTTMAQDVDVTQFTGATLASEHPAVAATAGIYADFMEAYRSCPNDSPVDLLDNYERICDTYLRRLQKVADHAPSKAGKAVACSKLLSEEKNTWQLTKILMRDRLEAEPDVETMLMDTDVRKTSDKDIVDALFARDSAVRRAQMVVDWLESCAAYEHDEEPDDCARMEYFSDGGCAWENTLYMLQARKVAPAAADGRVTELDPDAPSRQQLALTDEDSKDEARLLRSVFRHLRQGQLQKAQQLAIDQGYHWLAAALEGWRPPHDPNTGGFLNGSTSMQPTEGNAYRDLWKSQCWMASASSGTGTYERAIYAALCGNLQELLPVCLSWKDHLWARLRALVDIGIEQELRVATQQVRQMEPLPKNYPAGRGSLVQVFESLSATPNAQVQKQGEFYYSVVQRCIILDDTYSLMEEMHEWSTQQQSRHLVRFMAHMALALRSAGYALDDAAFNAVLRAYVKDLIREKCVPVVATYVAALPPGEQVEHYAYMLEELKVQDSAEQERCLEWARDAGLDVPAITRTLVEHVRTADAETDPGATTPSLEVTPEDREKISSLDWLLFDVEMRGEALCQANALMRDFILRGNVKAAREASEKLPPDTVQVAASSRQRVGSEAERNVREYFCLCAYLQAQQSFQNWFSRFHHHKPQPVGEPPVGAKFSEMVAYEHKVRNHSIETDKWRDAVARQAREVSKNVYNVLLFVDGGWMVDVQAGGGDEGRQRQMSALRKLCIPSLTFLLHEALHASGMLRECMAIADVIASERHKLYAEFGRQELYTLLSRIRDSSLKLLDSGCDALGYAVE